MRLDPVGIIEACYAPAGEDREWLQGVLEAAQPLDRGLGAAAAVFSTQDGRLTHHALASRNLGEEQLARSVAFWEREADPALVRAIFPPGVPVALWSRIARRLPTTPLPLGTASDALAILAIDHDGRGVFLTTPSPRRIQLASRTQQQLTGVSAHLLSALRLRARVPAAPGPAGEGVEAVLDPDGRVQHAVAAARAAPARAHLAAAVQRVERARGRLRRADPEEAVALWTGLVDGRWSLVDHCEADGRRLVLARRNEPGVRDPRALAPRERDVLAYALQGHANKHIGYLLGIAPSTVASHLRAALAKLRVRSRRELLAAMGGPRR